MHLDLKKNWIDINEYSFAEEVIYVKDSTETNIVRSSIILLAHLSNWWEEILIGIRSFFTFWYVSRHQAMDGPCNFLFDIYASHISASDQHRPQLQWVVNTHEFIIKHLQYTDKIVTISDNETWYCLSYFI